MKGKKYMNNEITYKTVVIDKNGYTCEIWDTMNWGVDFIYEMFDEKTAEKICEYWGK